MDFRDSLGSLVRFLARFIRFVLPPLLRVVWMALQLLYATFFSVCKGLSPEINNLSEKIMNDTANYVPADLHGILRWFSLVVAFVTILLGFVMLAYVTVWAWEWLWRVL